MVVAPSLTLWTPYSIVTTNMLPQHYQIHRPGSSDDEDDDDTAHRTGRGTAAPPFHQPPLGVTGVICDTHSLLIPGWGTLQYTIFRPRYVHMKPPLLCVAGGPYLPWQYLSTLVHLVNDRSLIFFDPVGCGQSKRITKKEEKSNESSSTNPVPQMVSDLGHLVQHLKLEHFHLFGHSFGGIVAYEALVSQKYPGKCLSLILTSTPANIKMAMREIDELKAALAPRGAEASLDADETVAQAFAARHECRVRPLPLQLQQSFAMAGFYSSQASWQSIVDYVAQPSGTSKPNIPLLLLRGEFDFISESCMEPWRDCIQNDDSALSESSVITLAGVAHYGMLEDEQAFGAALRTFLSSVLEPALQIPRPAGPSVNKRSQLPR